MPYKYRATEHSPHSRSAGILQDTVDWASPSPELTAFACVAVCTSERLYLEEL